MGAPDPAPPNTRLRKNAVGVIGIVFFVLSAPAQLIGIAGLILSAAAKSHAHRWRPGEALEAVPGRATPAT